MEGGMMYLPHHQFQRYVCNLGLDPVLNIGCADDPADLARDFGAVNMDMVRFGDPPNWRHGNALDTQEPDQYYGTVILGEILEHMVEEAAELALKEAVRILKPMGVIGITTPYDRRTFEEQCLPGHRFTDGVPTEVAMGCWEHHLSVWTPDRLRPVLRRAGLRAVHESNLYYGVRGCEYGAGRVLMKIDDLK